MSDLSHVRKVEGAIIVLHPLRFFGVWGTI